MHPKGHFQACSLNVVLAGNGPNERSAVRNESLNASSNDRELHLPDHL
jgi:hypothetical protein